MCRWIAVDIHFASSRLRKYRLLLTATSVNINIYKPEIHWGFPRVIKIKFPLAISIQSQPVR